jgi:hypothetical protein
MKLAERLVKKINRKYAPSSIVSLRFGRQDIVWKTDKDGDAVSVNPPGMER